MENTPCWSRWVGLQIAKLTVEPETADELTGIRELVEVSKLISSQAEYSTI